MQAMIDEQMLTDDREDLIALLRMRFGEISGDIIEEIYRIRKLEAIQRLILIAANAEHWRVFVEELQSGEDSVRLVGERFQPAMNGRETIG